MLHRACPLKEGSRSLCWLYNILTDVNRVIETTAERISRHGLTQAGVAEDYLNSVFDTEKSEIPVTAAHCDGTVRGHLYNQGCTFGFRSGEETIKKIFFKLCNENPLIYCIYTIYTEIQIFKDVVTPPPDEMTSVQ